VGHGPLVCLSIGPHASKVENLCYRGAWSEKGWEPLM